MWLRRPPKMMADTATPSGSLAAGSSAGLLAIGAVNRLLGCAALRPQSGVQCLAGPVDAFLGRFGGLAFPPHIAIGQQRHVGVDGVAGHAGHGVGIGLRSWCRAPRRNSRLRD